MTTLIAPSFDLSAPAEDERRLARQLKAIGNPIRLRILVSLRQAALGVEELVERLGVPQSTMSRHLAWLTQAGLVGYRVYGSRHRYSVNGEALRALLTRTERHILGEVS